MGLVDLIKKAINPREEVVSGGADIDGLKVILNHFDYSDKSGIVLREHWGGREPSRERLVPLYDFQVEYRVKCLVGEGRDGEGVKITDLHYQQSRKGKNNILRVSFVRETVPGMVPINSKESYSLVLQKGKEKAQA